MGEDPALWVPVSLPGYNGPRWCWRRKGAHRSVGGAPHRHTRPTPPRCGSYRVEGRRILSECCQSSRTPSLTLSVKINSVWITGLNAKFYTIKLLEKERNLQDLRLGKSVFRLDTKSPVHKREKCFAELHQISLRKSLLQGWNRWQSGRHCLQAAGRPGTSTQRTAARTPTAGKPPLWTQMFPDTVIIFYDM